MGTFPKQVKIVEVGPRDGLQNEKVMLEINQKSVFEPWEFHVVRVARMDRARQDITLPHLGWGPGNQVGPCDR